MYVKSWADSARLAPSAHWHLAILEENVPKDVSAASTSSEYSIFEIHDE